jgi:FlaA1/EpsC-like NDP-sugar epimerase
MSSFSILTGAPEIDWYSFLGRQRLPRPSPASLDSLEHTSILVTGAGGSIGSALSSRLAALKPRCLVLLDSSEQALHRLHSLLGAASGASYIRLVLGDVGHESLLAELFERYRPQSVFHAAAYKQVPLLEKHPLEAIENNALKTGTLVKCAHRSGCARLVLLSTDKAVEPISILGATKRIAERIVLAQGGIVLRLGNVLGTEGSVSEVFKHQIANGGPLTITGRDQHRYFLTRDEAVDLLLAAAVDAPARAILAPALDRQYSIASLADFLAKTLAPEHSIPVIELEPRSADKVYEKLWASEEVAASVADHGYFQFLNAGLQSESEMLAENLSQLQVATTRRDREAALSRVCTLAPDYATQASLLSTLGMPSVGGSQ